MSMILLLKISEEIFSLFLFVFLVFIVHNIRFINKQRYTKNKRIESNKIKECF